MSDATVPEPLESGRLEDYVKPESMSEEITDLLEAWTLQLRWNSLMTPPPQQQWRYWLLATQSVEVLPIISQWEMWCSAVDQQISQAAVRSGID